MHNILMTFFLVHADISLIFKFRIKGRTQILNKYFLNVTIIIFSLEQGANTISKIYVVCFTNPLSKQRIKFWLFPSVLSTH